jgi:hypothetical protein
MISNHFSSPYNQSSTIYSPRPQHQQSPGQRYHQQNGGSDGLGSSSNSAIDLTSANLPSPPRSNPKAPLFIGAITTEAMMFYPSPLMVMGSDLSGMRERPDIANFKGAEFVKVKLKVTQHIYLKSVSPMAQVLICSIEPQVLNRNPAIHGLLQGLTLYKSCRR